ncbi:hypothetical protein IWQ56_000355 [Coemansia nantahalensis]|nr:hypothetical protein IWQ56_000355 [Coemansia nantahalensis]
MCDDATHITLIRYESGLGRPGIMSPTVSSSVEITVAADRASSKVVKQVYENNRPGSKHEGKLGDDTSATVLELVSTLCALPVREPTGGPDVFGENTVAIVRQGKSVVWSYNPGSGCSVVPEDDASLLAVTDEHRTTFANVVSKIYEAGETGI